MIRYGLILFLLGCAVDAKGLKLDGGLVFRNIGEPIDWARSGEALELHFTADKILKNPESFVRIYAKFKEDDGLQLDDEKDVEIKDVTFESATDRESNDNLFHYIAKFSMPSEKEQGKKAISVRFCPDEVKDRVDLSNTCSGTYNLAATE